MPEWWSSYFDAIYLSIYEDQLTEERSDAEVDALLPLLREAPGRRLVDAPCGWGRHAVPLALHGCEVVGVDRSAFLLGDARRRARERGARVDFCRSDLRELPFRRTFDAALCLFSSLGYFGSDAEDVRALRALRRTVRAGGLLILETMHRDLVAREFVERDWWETSRGLEVRVEREFDPIAGISREHLYWRSPDGTGGSREHEIRVRSATEWNAALEQAGWTPLEWLDGWTLAPFSLSSENLLVLARSPE